MKNIILKCLDVEPSCVAYCVKTKSKIVAFLITLQRWAGESSVGLPSHLKGDEYCKEVRKHLCHVLCCSSRSTSLLIKFLLQLVAQGVKCGHLLGLLVLTHLLWEWQIKTFAWSGDHCRQGTWTACEAVVFSGSQSILHRALVWASSLQDWCKQEFPIPARPLKGYRKIKTSVGSWKVFCIAPSWSDRPPITPWEEWQCSPSIQPASGFVNLC